MTLFDPATQLSWTQTLGDPPPTFVATGDQITAFSLVGSQLMVRPSASRYDNWGQFEHNLFEGLWSNERWGIGYPFDIDLKAILSKLGESRLQALKANGHCGWLAGYDYRSRWPIDRRGLDAPIPAQRNGGFPLTHAGNPRPAIPLTWPESSLQP